MSQFDTLLDSIESVITGELSKEQLHDIQDYTKYHLPRAVKKLKASDR